MSVSGVGEAWSVANSEIFHKQDNGSTVPWCAGGRALEVGRVGGLDVDGGIGCRRGLVPR
jgi:hypothetical protein